MFNCSCRAKIKPRSQDQNQKYNLIGLFKGAKVNDLTKKREFEGMFGAILEGVMVKWICSW